MNADGCKAPFPESELRRGLPAKTMDLCVSNSLDRLISSPLAEITCLICQSASSYPAEAS